MAPSRKAKSVNRRSSYTTEVASKKKGDNVDRSGQRKRKLSDMLGPQWSKEELERFYEAYRKYGKDWKKVAVVVRNRSVEMVEALYTMNRAYLSLPEGTASVVGLIAMMTDHYGILEGSDSEQESDEGTEASPKSQKRVGGKLLKQSTKGSDGPFPDLLQFQSAASNYGCMSLLKKKRSESRPRAVAKRTPRVPVSYSYDKDNAEKYLSPIRQGLKAKVGTIDDDVAHEIALALTEASQRGGSPQVSQTPKRKREHHHPLRLRDESETTSSKLRGSEMDEGGCELSSESTEADNGYYARDESYLMDAEGAGTVEVQQRGKRCNKKKPKLWESVNNHLDDIKEACSGTEEGQTVGGVKGKFVMEVADEKTSRLSFKGLRKRSKKVLFKRDEGSDFDALQTLADLSLMMPETTVDTESYVPLKEEKPGTIDESKPKGNQSSPRVKFIASKITKLAKYRANEISVVPEAEDQIISRTRRQKFLPFKLRMDMQKLGDCSDSLPGKSQKFEATDELKKFVSKGKRTHGAAHPKQGKLVKPSQHSSTTDHGKEWNDSSPSTVHVLPTNHVNLPTKVRSRRKMDTRKALVEKDTKSSDDMELVSYCLSRYQVRRCSLGRPRRFSEQFLKEEKEKLNQYRESVRTHYAELRDGTREGLPTDLARPLYVGQRIIAVHPRTREIHDGSVLTVDRSRYRVQFDRRELGVEFVRDIDCMPLNPLENLPTSLARQTTALGKFIENINDLKMSAQPRERNLEEYIKFAQCENLESTHGPSHISPSTNYHINNLLQQQKVVPPTSNSQVKVGPSETLNTQQAIMQPSIIAQIQAKEADVQALSELTRALDKKEAVVSELRRMNDEVFETQKDGDSTFKDSESFKKHYAAIVLQLNEINEQVSSALFCLRQRNTYQGNIPLIWPKPIASLGEPAGHSSSLDHSAYQTLESGSQVAEIVESSRTKAQKMVDAAVQAVSSFKKGGSGIERIEEAMDFVNNRLSVDDTSMPSVRPSTPADPVNITLPCQDQHGTSTTSPVGTSHAPDSKSNNLNDENAAQIPSDLIAHCVATMLMIQKCTERQFPPGDVAQALDSAVTSLQPCCSQNLPIYAEIQKCMGIIKNQILALIPT
ncbi:hypothetical protein Dsin_029337 [Dipteronia sinensis]|uniref:SANT domain-containing protein n=1 Tax=Dipteronia sinensis TaxID=43782 RepID=A0AAE0DVE0_9ROSI|nr:hypothetical protein Dsin_029337 [Dipteronia sinensis]